MPRAARTTAKSTAPLSWSVAVCGLPSGRGELRGLRWSDVDLASEPAVIRVRRTWDDVEGEVEA